MLETNPQKTNTQIWRSARVQARFGPWTLGSADWGQEREKLFAFRDSHLRPPPAEGESRSLATVQRCEEPAAQRAAMGLFLAVAQNQLRSDQPRKADFRGKKVVGGVRLVPHTPPGHHRGRLLCFHTASSQSKHPAFRTCFRTLWLVECESLESNRGVCCSCGAGTWDHDCL